jgi:hypothetical protein
MLRNALVAGCDHDVSLWQSAGKCTCGGQRGVVYAIVRRGRGTGTDQEKNFLDEFKRDSGKGGILAI